MNRCSKHPKYTGKRAPKTQCLECLSYYIKLGKMTRGVMPPPTKIFKDKTKYSRKKKHKDKD
jgi:hypothetical protein